MHPSSDSRSSQDDGGSSCSHVTEYRILDRPLLRWTAATKSGATSHFLSITSALGCCCGSCYKADMVHEMVVTAADVNGLPKRWVLDLPLAPRPPCSIMQPVESSCTSLFLLARSFRSSSIKREKGTTVRFERPNLSSVLEICNQARRAHAAPSDSVIPCSAGVARIASCSRMRPQKFDFLPEHWKKVTAFECNSLHGHPFFPSFRITKYQRLAAPPSVCVFQVTLYAEDGVRLNVI